MTTLAQTLNEMSLVLQKIEENGGEITDDILPVFTAVESSVAQKVDKYVNFTDAVSAQIDKTKKTIEKFKTNLKTLESLEQRLKSNVKHLMESHDLLKIQGEEREIKLVNNGGNQAMVKPDDMFVKVDAINTKYIEEFLALGLIWPEVIYVLKDKEKFERLVKENKIKDCFYLPRGKYVRFT